MVKIIDTIYLFSYNKIELKVCNSRLLRLILTYFFDDNVRIC